MRGVYLVSGALEEVPKDWYAERVCLTLLSFE
jgi:hypothetical protein